MIIYVMERDEDKIIGAQMTESLEVPTQVMTTAVKCEEGDGGITTVEGAVLSLIPLTQMPYL